MTYLIIIACVLAAVLGSRLMQIGQLSSTLRGTSDELITESDNRSNGYLMMAFMIAFFAFCLYQLVAYSKYVLPEAASEHGKSIDTLMNFNLIVVTLIFVVVNVLLFYFAFKYYGRKESKALYFAHSTKLEMIWTIIPAIFLAVIIIYGLTVWTRITTPYDKNDAVLIELYAKQFDWTARYAGKDGKLGSTNYKYTSDSNPLALDTIDLASNDDQLVRGEFHLPVNRQVVFKFRSRDVIHSAYMPHFRAQMNCVPGMETEFHFKPTITTAEMRQKLGKPEFNYLLVCNKICGAAHYNMQMTIVVESEADYNKWIASQAPFKAPATPAAPATDSTATTAMKKSGSMNKNHLKMFN